MKHIFTLVLLFCSLTLPAQLRINELMSNNVSAVWDDAYNFSMWVEFYNSSASAVNQNYYYLSDDPLQPRKWQLPSKIISSRGYSTVWMEKPDRANHAPFKLNPEGGALYLFTSTGTLTDYVVYPAQHRNVSYGRIADGSGEWVFFEDFSAGSSNAGKAKGIVRCSPPSLSIPGGLYASGVTVRFETPEPGDTIFYNLNSEEPTRAKSVRYVPGNSITINSNSVLRAKTFRAGKLSSDITTATYIIGQRNFNLPVVSLVTPSAYLNDNTVGIYVAGTNGITGNGADGARNWNQDWDRPANFELFDKNKITRLNQELDIQIAGGWSRLNGQKSLHIQPKKKFGNNKLEYPVFGSRSNLQYKDIALRNSGNDFRYSMMRDGMMQSLIIGRMDLEYLAYEPAVLYLNGVYYGIQNLRERSNADLLYTTHGLDDDEVKILDSWTISGDTEYQEMLNYILVNDIAKPEVYDQLKTKMDVDNYINYLITQIYLGNYDWPHNNIKMWKKNVGGKWRWILFDTDFGFNLYDGSLHTFNSLTYALGENSGKSTQPWATRLFSRLVFNESFRNTFIDRFSVHLSTTFQPLRVNQVIDSLAAKIRTEITFHKNRWGSDRAFETDITIMKTFSSARANNMLSFVSNRFLNGAALQTLTLSSNHPNARYTFNNELIQESSVSLRSFNGRNYTLKANPIKGYVFKRWELTGVTAIQTLVPWHSEWKYWDASSVPASNWYTSSYSDAGWKTGQAQLGYGGRGEKTTVGYGPDSNNKNPTAYFRKAFNVQNSADINSATVRIFVDDGAAVYVNGSEIGRYNMPAGNISYSTYSTTYNNGDSASFTIPASLLKNGSNLIAVEVHQVNATSSDLIFNLSLIINTMTSASNEYNSPTLEGKVSANQALRAIYDEDLTPDPVPTAKIRINEIVASNTIVKDEYGENDDYVELYNAGNETIDISGWYISDKKENPRLWQLPSDETLKLAPGGFLVLWADEQPQQGASHVSFKLSASGEYLSLSAENKFGELIEMDAVQFPALESDQSYSRYPDGLGDWRIQASSLGLSNVLTSTPSVDVVTIKVSPIHFTDRLTIENATGLSIHLYDIAGKRIHALVGQQTVEHLNVETLPSGVYVLRVGEQSFRLLK